MAISAGRLRNLMTVREPVRDQFGKRVSATEVCKLWMSIDPLRGKEMMEGLHVEPILTHRGRSRYQPGIKHSMELVDSDGEVYQIAAVVPDNKRRELTFTLAQAEGA